MGKRKNLKNAGLSDEELSYIDEKMKTGVDERYNKLDVNCNKVLDFKINLKCKTQKQKEFHKTIKEKDITFCSAYSGVGKSFIVFGTFLELLKQNNQYNKIIIIVPTSVSSDDIGLLPGGVDEKIQPFYEAHIQTIEKILNLSGNFNSKEIVRNLIKCEILEIRPCNYLRGFSISNALIVVEESQNLVKHSIKTILTRMESSSKIVLVGDLDQIDNKYIIKNKNESGLKYAIDKLKEIPEVGIVEFDKSDIVRNPLISKILDKWNEEK